MLRLIIFFTLSLFSFFGFGAETHSSSELLCSNPIPIFGAKWLSLPDEITYPRDHSFPLKHAGGHQYIPYQFLEGKDKYRLIDITETTRAAILGYYMDMYGKEFGQLKKELIGTVGELFGVGFKNGQLLVKFMKNNNIKYKNPGLTTVEGGNVHFISHKGKTKVIMGDHSLIVTVIADLIDDYFPNFTKGDFKISNTDPNYLLRNLDVVRSLDLKQYFSVEDSKIFKKEYDKYLQNYISPIINNLDKSRVENAKKNVSYALHLIAKELELEVDDIFIIPQRKYHIDMDLFITPDGKIVLRAPNSNAEKKIWEKQYEILERYFSKDNIIEVPEEFSDPALFCGVLTSEKFNTYVYIRKELHADFDQFISNKLGLVPFGQPADLTSSNAGAHCLVQEYFYNIKQPNICATCKNPEPKSRCSRCKEVWYCNRDCQKEHWSVHAKTCQKIVTK